MYTIHDPSDQLEIAIKLCIRKGNYYGNIKNIIYLSYSNWISRNTVSESECGNKYENRTNKYRLR